MSHEDSILVLSPDFNEPLLPTCSLRTYKHFLRQGSHSQVTEAFIFFHLKMLPFFQVFRCQFKWLYQVNLWLAHGVKYRFFYLITIRNICRNWPLTKNSFTWKLDEIACVWRSGYCRKEQTVIFFYCRSPYKISWRQQNWGK